MDEDAGVAVLERSADIIIVYANTACKRTLTPNEWIAYNAAMALFQQVATAFEITIDRQIIEPSVKVEGPDGQENVPGNNDPELNP